MLIELSKENFSALQPETEKDLGVLFSRLVKAFIFDQTHPDLIDALIALQSFASSKEDYILLIYDLGLLKGTLAVTLAMDLDPDQVFDQLLKKDFARQSYAFWAGVTALKEEDKNALPE